MVGRSVVCGTLIVLGLLGAGTGTTPAASITFTGNVENDFPTVSGNGVYTKTNPDALATSVVSWMKADSRQSGMVIKDIRMAYDQASDTLSVGVNFLGIGGDVDGNGVVGSLDPRASGSRESTNFGGGQAVVLGFDFNGDRTTDMVAGIPLSKPFDPATGQPVDGVTAFSLAQYKPGKSTLADAFGSTTVGTVDLLNHIGQKSLETSAAKPDLEFQITDFSQVAKLFNPNFDVNSTSFGFSAISKAFDAAIVGESVVAYTSVSAQELVPEPATILAWSVTLAGAAVVHYRRRKRTR